MMSRRKQIILGIILLVVFVLDVVTIGTKLHFIPDGKLSGAEMKQPFPPISFKTFWKGKWQEDLEKWLSSNVGLRAFFIRLDNQMNYSIFDELSAKGGDTLRLGKNKWIYEKSYIDNFNKLDTVSLTDLEGQVKSLKKLQTILAAKGIYSLLLITPSKAGIYPEYIKNTDIILNRSVKQTNYEKILPLLKQYQVQYFDGRQFIMELKKTSPYPLFPGSGIHWNYYSSYLATAQLIAYLENGMNQKMTRIHYRRIIAESAPIENETDMAGLTNVIFTRTFYDHTYYHPETFAEQGKETFRPKMLFIGGSFLWQILYYLDKYQVYSERDMLYYYERHFRYPERTEQALTAADKESASLRQRILSQHIIVIESNEADLDRIGAGFINDALTALDPAAEE